MAYTGPFLDRVSETVTTTGTGSVTTSSNAANSLVNWASAATTGNPYYYLLTSGNGTDWETGLATVTISGSAATLTRTNITASSNSGSAISLTGTSTISSNAPAGLSNTLLGLGNYGMPGAFQAGHSYRPSLLNGRGTPSAINTSFQNYLGAQAFIFPPGSATVKSVSVWVSTAPTTAYNWEGGIYADAGNGSPGNLVSGSDTGSVSTGTAVGASTYTYATPIALPPGVYWVTTRFSTGGSGGTFQSTAGQMAGSLACTLQGVSSTQGGVASVVAGSEFPGWASSAPGTFGTFPATFTNGGTLYGGCGTGMVIGAIPYLSF